MNFSLSPSFYLVLFSSLFLSHSLSSLFFPFSSSELCFSWGSDNFHIFTHNSDNFPPIFLPCLFSISLKIFVYSLHKAYSERASNLQEYMNWFGKETHFLTVIFCNAKLWVSFIVSTCIPVIWFYRCKLLKKT